VRRLRTIALLVAAGLGAGYIQNVIRADSAPRLQALQHVHDQLHARLEEAVGRDPIAAHVFADRGQLVVAIRAGLIEDLTARIARQYLQQVTLDLGAVQAHADGTLRKDTFLGQKRVGDWDLTVTIHKLIGQLRAGEPRLTFARNVLDVELPVEIQPASGQIGLHFAWDSKSIANLVCKDFEVNIDLDGRAPRQKHVLRGQIVLSANDAELKATPIVPDRSFMLKVDLTPRSWAKVEAELRAQDTAGRCGMFMNPQVVLHDLRELVTERGLKIKLPERIIRPVRLPARFEQTVKVNDSVVQLSLEGERLTSSDSMLWSSTKIGIASAEPGAAKPTAGSEARLSKTSRGVAGDVAHARQTP
jgi:hypothetical protein